MEIPLMLLQMLDLTSGLKKGLDINVLKAILDTNNKVRTNRDWEDQKGRAVI